MKKLMIAAAATLCAAVGFSAVESANIVGYSAETVARSAYKAYTVRYLNPGDTSGKVAIQDLINQTNPGKGADATKATADKLYIWNGSSYDLYYLHTSGKWCAEGSTTPTEAAVDFGTAFFYKKGSLTQGTATVSGEVYDAADSYTVTLTRGSMKFLTFPWPVEQTLEQIGACITNPGKGADSTKPTADKIYKWNGSSYDIYYRHTSAGWCAEGSTTAVEEGSVRFGINEGFFVKKGSLTAGGITFANPLR